MLRILISAYAVSPDRGSEPGMGWNWCRVIAGFAEVHIITEGEFREQIEAALPQIPEGKRMHFYYLPVSERIRKMCWNQGDWRFYFYYRKWQKRALEQARSLCTQQHFDLIHQLNMVGYREPGFLYRIQGVPIVWGPISRLESAPTVYFKHSPKDYAKILIKNWLNALQRQFHPRVHRMIRRASCILASSREDAWWLHHFHASNVFVTTETASGWNQYQSNDVSGNPYHPSKTLLYVGKIVPWKQPDLAIRTLSLLPPDVCLVMAGDGSDAYVQYCRRLVDEHDLKGRVVWLGQVPHERIPDLMHEADLFFFTSVIEATSTVILEAISAGLPIVCFDTCGFGPLITPDIGRKIPLSRPSQSIRDFASEILSLLNDPIHLQQMRKAALEKAQTLSWEEKRKQLETIYHSVLFQ